MLTCTVVCGAIGAVATTDRPRPGSSVMVAHERREIATGRETRESAVLRRLHEIIARGRRGRGRGRPRGRLTYHNPKFFNFANDGVMQYQAPTYSEPWVAPQALRNFDPEWHVTRRNNIILCHCTFILQIWQYFCFYIFLGW